MPSKSSKIGYLNANRYQEAEKVHQKESKLIEFYILHISKTACPQAKKTWPNLP